MAGHKAALPFGSSSWPFFLSFFLSFGHTFLSARVVAFRVRNLLALGLFICAVPSIGHWSAGHLSTNRRAASAGRASSASSLPWQPLALPPAPSHRFPPKRSMVSAVSFPFRSVLVDSATKKRKKCKKKTNPWPRFCVVGAFRLVCFWLVFFLFLAGRTTDAAVMIGRRRLPRRRDVMDVASRRWRVCPSAKVRPRRLFTSAPVGFQFIDCIFLFLLLAGPVLVIFFYRLGIFFCSFRNGRSSFSFSLFRCKSLILFCWKERNQFWSYSFVFLCFVFFHIQSSSRRRGIASKALKY